MRYISFILFLFTFEAVKNTDMVCHNERSMHIIKIGEGDSYSFKTQIQTRAVSRNAPRTRCVVMYQRGPSCLEMRFHCTKFKVNNRRSDCRKMDRMEIMTPTRQQDFCGLKGPDVTTSGKFLKVTYLSKNKKQSTGEVCNMACVQSIPTPGHTEATSEGLLTSIEEIKSIEVSEVSCKNGICHHPFFPAPAMDNSCKTGSDCWKPGKTCHEIMDVGCICKMGQCKISSGCGTMGAFFFRNCTSCGPDNCEDEVACLVVDGKCQDKPKLTSSKLTSSKLTSSKLTSSNPTFAISKLPPYDNSCNSGGDCWKAGKRCHGIMDVGCICRQGQCKISSGCGTQGAFFFQSCTGCSPEGCEDEGACVLNDGVCQEKINPQHLFQLEKQRKNTP